MNEPPRYEPSAFGLRIKALRAERGWTQAQLSERARVPRLAVSQWETGARQSVSVRNLSKLAGAFGLATDTLLAGAAEQRK